MLQNSHCPFGKRGIPLYVHGDFPYIFPASKYVIFQGYQHRIYRVVVADPFRLPYLQHIYVGIPGSLFGLTPQIHINPAVFHSVVISITADQACDRSYPDCELLRAIRRATADITVEKRLSCSCGSQKMFFAKKPGTGGNIMPSFPFILRGMMEAKEARAIQLHGHREYQNGNNCGRGKGDPCGQNIN